MTTEELIELFKKHDDEYIRFERVENKLSTRPDLHAFITLDKIFPSEHDMVSCAEHDEIWISVTPEQLAEKATEELIIELSRCGIRYDSSADSLAMFV